MSARRRRASPRTPKARRGDAAPTRTNRAEDARGDPGFFFLASPFPELAGSSAVPSTVDGASCSSPRPRPRIGVAVRLGGSARRRPRSRRNPEGGAEAGAGGPREAVAPQHEVAVGIGRSVRCQVDHRPRAYAPRALARTRKTPRGPSREPAGAEHVRVPAAGAGRGQPVGRRRAATCEFRDGTRRTAGGCRRAPEVPRGVGIDVPRSERARA